MIALERWSEPWRRLAAAPPAGLLEDLANRDEVELREAAERIRRTLAGQAIDAVSRPIQVTIGGAVYPQAGADGDALFKAADDAPRPLGTAGAKRVGKRIMSGSRARRHTPRTREPSAGPRRGG